MTAAAVVPLPSGKEATAVGEDNTANTDFHPYVKVTVDSNEQTKRTTPVMHATPDPEWSEALHFQVPGREKQASLRVKNTIRSGLLSSITSRNSIKTRKRSRYQDRKISEVRIHFEAWHRDLSVSLDDRIGAATLALNAERFTHRSSFSSRESVRLYNSRGMITGLLFVMLKWNRMTIKMGRRMGMVIKTLSPNESHAVNVFTKADEEDGPGDAFSLFDEDEEDELAHFNPHGTLTVVVERAHHLRDPNKIPHLAITRSTRILIISTAIVLGKLVGCYTFFFPSTKSSVSILIILMY